MSAHRFATTPFVLAALVLAACSSPTHQTALPTPVAVPGWPSSIAAIGHSGLTGYDSGAPGVDAPDNSWATGDNPDVDSVYARLLAENPAIEGNVLNVARDGSGVGDLPRQVSRVVVADPQPDLVIVQSIDNDIRCDGTDTDNLEPYRDALDAVLDTLTTELPDATILFVSQPGSVVTYAAVTVPRDPAALAGTGPCDIVDPSTLQIVPDKVAGLQEIVDSYFRVITEVCSGYDNCLTDEGAMQAMPLVDTDVTPDGNHLTVPGHAKMAAIAWDVLYGHR